MSEVKGDRNKNEPEETAQNAKIRHDGYSRGEYL
jgi:hypothetical protein